MLFGLRRSLGAGVIATALLPACSLGNISHDECQSENECVSAFGFGSTCQEGYCTEGATCATTTDCTVQFGYGVACESGDMQP